MRNSLKSNFVLCFLAVLLLGIVFAFVACDAGDKSATGDVIFSGAENLNVKLNDTVDWTKNVTATRDGKEIEVTADTSNVDLTKSGNYTIVFRAGGVSITRNVKVYGMPVIYYGDEVATSGDEFAFTYKQANDNQGFLTGFTAYDSFKVLLEVSAEYEYDGGLGEYDTVWSATDAAGNVAVLSGKSKIDLTNAPRVDKLELNENGIEILSNLGGARFLTLYIKDGNNFVEIPVADFSESSGGIVLSENVFDGAGEYTLKLVTEYGYVEFNVTMPELYWQANSSNSTVMHYSVYDGKDNVTKYTPGSDHYSSRVQMSTYLYEEWNKNFTESVFNGIYDTMSVDIFFTNTPALQFWVGGDTPAPSFDKDEYVRFFDADGNEVSSSNLIKEVWYTMSLNIKMFGAMYSTDWGGRGLQFGFPSGGSMYLAPVNFENSNIWDDVDADTNWKQAESTAVLRSFDTFAGKNNVVRYSSDSKCASYGRVKASSSLKTEWNTEHKTGQNTRLAMDVYFVDTAPGMHFRANNIDSLYANAFVYYDASDTVVESKDLQPNTWYTVYVFFWQFGELTTDLEMSPSVDGPATFYYTNVRFTTRTHDLFAPYDTGIVHEEAGIVAGKSNVIGVKQTEDSQGWKYRLKFTTELCKQWNANFTGDKVTGHTRIAIDVYFTDATKTQFSFFKYNGTNALVNVSDDVNQEITWLDANGDVFSGARTNSTWYTMTIPLSFFGRQQEISSSDTWPVLAMGMDGTVGSTNYYLSNVRYVTVE